MKPTTKIPTQEVISMRVPLDVKATIDKMCKSQGTNRSVWLRETVVEMNKNSFYKKGGGIQARAIPKEIENILIASGTLVVGISVYNLVGMSLDNAVDNEGKPKYTANEIESLSIICAIVVGVAGYGILKHLFNE